jgi:leader peptidase (prepilin peptidase) / N-methyltransferase
MMTPVLALVGVLGLVVGSFLNVVIYRVPRGESLLRPRSHCVHCGAEVRPLQNVPVISWLVLRGRCANCGARISPRYPLVELGTALLFVAVTARFGVSPALPAFLYLVAIAVALALIDLDVKRLPDRIVLPSYFIGGILLVAAALIRHDWWPVGRSLIAMAVLAVCFSAIALGYKGGMGFGDVKLAGLLGLYLGWLGWNAVLVGTFAGFVLGGLVGVGLLIAHQANRRTPIPFGPFMLVGALLALFAATPIATWYQSLVVPTA